MLPHFVRQDFDDVLDELRDGRLPVRARVVRAALRVPLPAARRRRRSAASQLELRQAIEPWHVLGEEPAAGGTARYVDSSRRAAAGEGQRPDRPAARRHLQRPPRAAASDRARTASSSPACATAPGSRRAACIRRSGVHAPLVFDLVDTWTSRSIGGCTYHVSHPGRPELRDVPGERLRGREPAHRAVLHVRPHPRPDERSPGDRTAGVPVHAGPARP